MMATARNCGTRDSAAATVSSAEIAGMTTAAGTAGAVWSSPGAMARTTHAAQGGASACALREGRFACTWEFFSGDTDVNTAGAVFGAVHQTENGASTNPTVRPRTT